MYKMCKKCINLCAFFSSKSVDICNIVCYNVITVKDTEKSLKPERRIIMKKNFYANYKEFKGCDMQGECFLMNFVLAGVSAGLSGCIDRINAILSHCC